VAVSHCPLLSTCGLCKKEFSPIAHIRTLLSGIPTRSVELPELKIGFRHRARLRLRFCEQGRLQLGYHRPGSRSFVAIPDCTILSEAIREFIFNACRIKAIALANCTFRICVDEISGQKILISIHNQPHYLELVKALSEIPNCFVATNQNVFYCYDRQFNYDFYLAPFGFRQNHFMMNRELRNIVAEIVANDAVADYYCGHGNLSRFTNVEYGYDGDSASIEAANWQLLNRVYTSEFHPTRPAADVLIADPPRAGVAHTVVPTQNQRLVMIFCSKASLERFLAKKEQKKKVARAWVLNMFPYTDEAETILELS
jgi:tRNA/tmRNA/rRNA uracil-C5-methylase (TrmA/RlmC/RlmD family)